MLLPLWVGTSRSKSSEVLCSMNLFDRHLFPRSFYHCIGREGGKEEEKKEN